MVERVSSGSAGCERAEQNRPLVPSVYRWGGVVGEIDAQTSPGAMIPPWQSARPAVVPQVTGLAHRTGEHAVDPADPLVPGFVLR